MNNKILILVRHVKAIDGNKFLGNDFERPLLEDGKKEFKKLISFVRDYTIYCPKIIITSDAVRCFETAEILQEVYKLEELFLVANNSLYYGDGVLGKVENYFDELLKIKENFNTVALVGHNWTITNLASELLGESCVSMEKGSIMILELKDGKNWNDITTKSCELIAYITPKFI